MRLSGSLCSDVGFTLSVDSCLSSPSPSISKVVTDVMVKPPQPGDPSYELFDQVRDCYTVYSMYVCMYVCIL